jgi:hypothetical protein
MTAIFLATGDNDRYRKALETSGLRAAALPAAAEEYASFIEANSTGAVLLLLELTGENRGFLETPSAFLARPDLKIVCLSAAPGETERRKLLELGISDLLVAGDPEPAARYIAAITAIGNAAPGGKILSNEPRGPFAKVLGSIAERFGFSLCLTGGVDGLLGALAHGPVELILVNIGARGFDITEFMKKSYSNPDIKKYPLLAYKEMAEGLFVHEITSGLSRLTKSILSRDELLNLLITLFYKYETGPLVSGARALLGADSPAGVDTSSLRRLFYSTGPELCDMTAILTGERFARSLKTGAALHLAIQKTAGFLWLISPPRTGPTCGGGA